MQNGHNERSFLRIMACILHSASKLKWYLNETFHLAYLVRCLFGLLGVYYNKFKTELTATAFLSGLKTELLYFLVWHIFTKMADRF